MRMDENDIVTERDGGDGEELLALRRRNEELEAELEARTRFDGEIEEFSALFPDVSLREVPSEIWEDVKKGLPLSAAYARHEIKISRAKEEADRANSEAAERSGGAARGSTKFYFSPDEVKKMSETEVRHNYSVIIDSMKHWN